MSDYLEVKNMLDTALIALQNKIKEKQDQDPYIAAKIASPAILSKVEQRDILGAVFEFFSPKGQNRCYLAFFK